jgi:transcription-repair coupling factor (superfamily II helicase)
MKLNGLLEYAEQLPEIRAFLSGLEAGNLPATPLGVYHAARPYLTAVLARAMHQPLVVITARTGRARQWVDELRAWLPDEVPVHFFADGDALPYERIPWAPETRQRRLEALVSLLTWKGVSSPEGPGIFASPQPAPAVGQVSALVNLSARSGPLGAVGASRGNGVQSPAPVVVASARALMQKTLPVREMRAALRPIREGQLFDLNKVLGSWVGWGYEAAAVVEVPGQFSRRGGIVDIWPPNLRKPMRIELLGDAIDSLRSFDPSTQRTVARASEAWIGPASEALPKLGEQMAERIRGLDLSPCHPPARMEYERERTQLLTGTGCRNLEWYIPYLYSQPASLLDYLAETWHGSQTGGWLALDDVAEIMAALGDLESQAEQLAKDLAAAGDLPLGLSVPYFGVETMRKRFEPALERPERGQYPVITLGNSTLSGWATSETTELGTLFIAGPRFGGQVRAAVADIEQALARGERVIIASRQSPRLADIFRAETLGGETRRSIFPVEEVTVLPPPGLTLVQGVLDEGWLLRSPAAVSGRSPAAVSGRSPAAVSGRSPASLTGGSPTSPGGFTERESLWLLTDAELFGWGKPKPRKPLRPRAISPEVFFADVSPGDFVVHIEHGIGQFQGLVRMTLDGIEREYLQVDYAQGDRLYLPVHQADRLARYVGAGDAGPSLHRLGTSDWEQVKARAKRAVAEIAGDLLELYAAREVVRGHAFSRDVAWQAELEASFPYVETEDQLVAVEAVKHDMERARPMDRLICGDVGYGKTEVALRAAFKAIMDGKQVAILVPTTVLAQQHYTNFTRRLAAFPVNVAMLSRFQTPAQQDRTVAGLANGSMDLVVGTHRLLSNDVSFKDLGLLIVDEEQRFGVTHKERIKQMRTEVDVLTLTATPIPRTLHMSLTGVRDLSTIETPPEDRLPIKSFVGDFDDNLIRQAVLREMDRNGQVYFVHNRVQGIEQMAARVGKIVPEARIAIGHGQMRERDLSSVMLAFAEGEYDILVCTSIIESGLDIPNANTIIINRADQFGLAQLYQLRGRVGRSAVRAYAYFLVDKYKILAEDSRRRLEAIQEASELGAGFRIAMQDLEIRGAGELLGARQHGHIAAVGFDLYIRLLTQAVQEARERTSDSIAGSSVTLPAARDSGAWSGWDRPIPPAVTLDLNLPGRIPEDYVPEAALRLNLYRRLASLTDLEAIEDIAHELADRFGPIPEQVQNLLYIVRVKVLAISAGVEAINQEEGQFLIKCTALEALDRPALQERVLAQGVPARIARRGVWLEVRADDLWREDLVGTLETIRQATTGLHAGSV